ncbi:hypothetical protein PFAG_05378 [Plasmodium falciparum Santa Lucia]|uniref:Arp2/3 complex 34 kDa subunit n=14 Tax=Plasmodium falciparum TaxID=5833 RepID=Q8ILF9_PLAF7|nr:conserved Plasmodium protein, unknown function [Plasmodium falciparum 3D7]ETW16093.1 hypothetical protein PFFVO_04925 [Plasmodium falciparum Vietnam Oak-Knoll (FVO)]ETW28759.1 hypothetical protein PFFCH_03888 [Plasmodium falciparum FCH/4]ETW39977.1 hypothetical protein PFNF135_06003 [Plasmodium falciparum NF135/5.C10]ETW46843.1 hypothetical protein PFMALIP_05124 [Plasmodium falciparum MaliPS096_E11]ETW53946.1 hypothetical protein PFUGPA_03819 [Plasmodium falciparum Palo Alto/Uganda]ETW5825|eukprot:XP_001348458.1 conserved Plasmodium protein, unknown function [Plasmodium falciparum 3D7]
MSERLYKKIKSMECESNLYISNNKVLFESIYNLINKGVPVPSIYYTNNKIVDKETDRYVVTKYIYDVDDIIYKLEAHSKINLEKFKNIKIKCLEEEYLKDNEVEDSYKDDKYNQLDSLQIYVSHTHFDYIWNEYTMQYFLSCYHDEDNLKIHTHILEKEEFGYDLQIELYEIPTNPMQAFQIASHLSKIREALQCGPLMHFFLTKTNITENIFEKFIIRKNEVIFILKKNDYLLVLISIHFVDSYDQFIILGLCKNIHLTNKSMDLSGNLDCSFYTDFPSHLITSEFFIYNYEDDMHNYEQNKREGTEDNEDIDMDHNKNVDMERMHSMNSSGNIIINSSSINIEKNITNEENIETKKYQKETWKDYINNSFDENKIDDEIKLKVPNIGFISLKMDIKLFNACKDFSELIQISSRISHIIVSFRDFLKNSLILHRIKTRRMF